MIPIPSLSVIIPCYNGLPFVLEAVESVLCQADARVECVVVDDGSTDDSALAVANSFESRVRLIRQANAGAAAARNRGLAESNGDLVIWLDADDRLAPETLVFRRRPFADDRGLEMLAGINRVHHEDTGAEELLPRCWDAGYLEWGLLRLGGVAHLNALTFRRSALARVGGFDPSLKTAEDLDFFLRAWACLRWQGTERVLSWQRRGPYTSLTVRNGKVNNYSDIGRALWKNRSVVRGALGSDRPWREAYAVWAANFALVHLLQGERQVAAAWSKEAIRRGRLLAPRRTYKYLLEAMLPAAVYHLASRAMHRLCGTEPTVA